MEAMHALAPPLIPTPPPGGPSPVPGTAPRGWRTQRGLPHLRLPFGGAGSPPPAVQPEGASDAVVMVSVIISPTAARALSRSAAAAGGAPSLAPSPSPAAGAPLPSPAGSRRAGASARGVREQPRVALSRGGSLQSAGGPLSPHRGGEPAGRADASAEDFRAAAEAAAALAAGPPQAVAAAEEQLQEGEGDEWQAIELQPVQPGRSFSQRILGAFWGGSGSSGGASRPPSRQGGSSAAAAPPLPGSADEHGAQLPALGRSPRRAAAALPSPRASASALPSPTSGRAPSFPSRTVSVYAWAGGEAQAAAAGEGGPAAEGAAQQRQQHEQQRRQPPPQQQQQQ
jgi:hypothetical protein